MITPADAALTSCVLWACRAVQLWETRSRVGRGALIRAGAFGVEAACSHLRPAGESGSGAEGRGRGSAKASFLISHNNNGSLKVPFQMESFLLSDPSFVC